MGVAWVEADAGGRRAGSVTCRHHASHGLRRQHSLARVRVNTGRVHDVDADARAIRRTGDRDQHVFGIRIQLRRLFEKDDYFSAAELLLGAGYGEQAGEPGPAVLILDDALRFFERGEG